MADLLAHGPVGLNLSAMAVSASLIWWGWLRPQDKGLGWFGLAYSVLCAFNLAQCIRPDWANAGGAMQGAQWLLTLLISWIWLRLGRALPMAWRVGCAMGSCLIVLAACHDLIAASVSVRTSQNLWLHWAAPLALPMFMAMLMRRVVNTLRGLEQGLAERHRDNAAAQAAKNQLLTAISHDLRQPVSALGLITDLLHERLTEPDLRGLTDRLARAGALMEGLLKDLLDLSRLDSGTVTAQAQPVQLDALLHAIQTQEAGSAQQKGLRLRVHKRHATAWVDPILLDQILRHWVRQAIRHTERGGILLGVRSQGSHHLIQVWDTASGAAVSAYADLFDGHAPSESHTSEHRRGLNLDLAIARQAGQLLGLPIHVLSRTGQGHCFSVCVPKWSGRETHNAASSQ